MVATYTAYCNSEELSILSTDYIYVVIFPVYIDCFPKWH